MQPHFDARAHAYALRSLMRRTMREFLATVNDPEQSGAGDAALAENRAAVTAWRNFSDAWDMPRAGDLRADFGVRTQCLASGRKVWRPILAGPYRAGRAFLRRCDAMQTAHAAPPGRATAQFIDAAPVTIDRGRAAFLLRAARSRASRCSQSFAARRVAPGVYFIGGAGLRLAIGARR